MAPPAGPVACVVAALLGWLTATAHPQVVFRTENRTVPVFATVQDGDRLVTGLPRDAFEILDNGRPQPITIFENGVQPISIVVMLDMSGSMLGNLALVRNAAVQMFTRLLPSDRARVGNFGDRITISPAFTSDQNELIRALWVDLQPGGATPLWAAIDQAMTVLAPIEGRRVVLVLSDGRDNGRAGNVLWTERRLTLDDILIRAREEQFMVYAIGMRSRGARGTGGRSAAASEPDPGLRELAADSGGGYVELDETSALGPAFARVADELHRQYLVGFAPPEFDGKRHEVLVRVRQAGLTVRARRSYVAPTR